MNKSYIEDNREKSVSKLEELFSQYGVDERSLGWTKHKQSIRFAQMLSPLHIDGASLLDVGCGFGDLLTYIKTEHSGETVDYTGIDIVPEFIDVAKQKNGDGSFLNTDLFKFESYKRYKYVVACGCLTYLDPKREEESYEFVEAFITKALDYCTDDGVAVFHFMTDKVDFKSSEEDFHITPERMLQIAYKHSRRVVLDNSIFPFEACLFIYKDDSFKKETTVFNID